MLNSYVLVLYFVLSAYSAGLIAATAAETTAVRVRLAGVGSLPNAGRLEVYYRFTWGTVCDDYFDNRDARVACRMLGFKFGRFNGNQYGTGSGQIWLDKVQCAGNERSIAECRHREWGRHGCSHSEDVSISCSNDTVVLEISEGNRVILAGTSITLRCYWSSTPAYWHFYSLTSGAAPCSFNSSQLHPGIFLCPSAPRISLANSYYSQRNKTTLIISKAQLSDAGTYICGSRNPRSLSTAYSVIVGVIASYPIATPDVTDGCIPEGQEVSLTCQVTYSGTNLMPLATTWYKHAWISGSNRNFRVDSGDTVNTSSVHQSSLTFKATTTDIYNCKVSFSSPTGIVVRGVQEQSRNTPTGNFRIWSPLCISRTLARVGCVIVSIDCNEEPPTIEFRLVGGETEREGRLEVSYYGGWGTVCDDHFNDTAAAVACHTLGYGVRRSGVMLGNRYGPGTGQIWMDDVKCQGDETSLASCEHNGWATENCGHGEDVSIACNGSSTESDVINRSTTYANLTGFQDSDTSTSYKYATVTLAVLLSIILVGAIAAGACVLYRRAGIKPCVRTSTEENNTNELDESPNIENMYVNAVALAAAKDDTTESDEDGEKSQSVYQDLNIGAGTAEPIFYETIKPRVLPKPPPRAESNA